MANSTPARLLLHLDTNEWLFRAMVTVAIVLGAPRLAMATSVPSPGVQIDLSGPFKTHSRWRLGVSQDPPTLDRFRPGPAGVLSKEDEVPGLVHLCLEDGPTQSCDPTLAAVPRPAAPLSPAEWDPHYVNQVEIVYPLGRTAAPLLLLQTASEHSGDGDQAIFTQLLRYDSAQDRFKQIYGHVTGHNNNQEVRFIVSGSLQGAVPLQGAVISAEPMYYAPFTYWITVNRLTSGRTYRQVLRYRSSTVYNDGNDLSVIDSEMPNIEQHLGLWRPGRPLPLPGSGPCQKPRLIRHALWCK